MKRRRAGVIGCAIVLSGCASLYTGGPVDEAISRLPVPPRQRAIIHTFSPSAAAELAIENSDELRAERKALEIRASAWRLGMRSYFPGFELSYGSDERISMYSSDSFSKSISASLTQPIWDGGRLRAARTLESAALDMSRAALDRKTRDTGEEAVKAYRSVAAARARLEIQRDARERAAGDRDILSAEVRLGVATDADLIEAEIALNGMGIDQAQAELALLEAESELSDILGVDAMPSMLSPLDVDISVVALDIDKVASSAVDSSAELAEARFSLVRKRAEARVAALGWLPTIGFTAGATAGGPAFPLGGFRWTAGLTVDFSGPLLSGSAGLKLGGDFPYDRSAASSGSMTPIPDPAGMTSARQAALDYELELERYASLTASVDREARSAVTSYLIAARRLELCKASLELSGEKCRLASVKLELGQAVRSEALKAEQERAERAIDLIDAAEQLRNMERAIERLLGAPPGSLGGLSDPDERGSP